MAEPLVPEPFVAIVAAAALATLLLLSLTGDGTFLGGQPFVVWAVVVAALAAALGLGAVLTLRARHRQNR